MKTLFTKNLSSLILFFVFLFTLSFTNSPAQWVQKSSSIGTSSIVYALASIGTTLFAGTAGGDGVWKSTNNGDNWTQTTLNNQSISSFYVSGGTIYACGSGIFKSTNLGTSWTPLTLSQGVGPITSIGAYLVAGTGANGLFYSSNDGATWSPSSITSGTSWAFTTSGANLFVGMQFSGVRLSTNQGVSWSNTSLGSTNVLSLLTNGSNIYAGTEFNGIHVSTNNGLNWTQTSFLAFGVNSIISQSSFLFVGASNVGAPDIGGVFISSNGGGTWQMRNQGFGGIYSIHSLVYHNAYMFAGTFGGGVWRRGYSEIIAPVGISNTNNVIPEKFSLEQNYPNPFNPTTRINYELPITNYVSLKVYDALGNEVETLVNEHQNAGSYSVDFNAAALPSGIYFYKLVTEKFSETKKMILVK